MNKEFLGNVAFDKLLQRALHETDDSIVVLVGGGLHPVAVAHLKEAHRLTLEAIDNGSSATNLIEQAITQQKKARDAIVE